MFSEKSQTRLDLVIIPARVNQVLKPRHDGAGRIGCRALGQLPRPIRRLGTDLHAPAHSVGHGQHDLLPHVTVPIKRI